MYIADLYGQAVVVLKDSAVAALADVPSAAPHTVTPTVVRGILRTGNSIQNTGNREELLDATGRRVLILGPGDNDVTSLAPGVYFIHEAQAQAQAQAVRKVIIAR